MWHMRKPAYNSMRSIGLLLYEYKNVNVNNICERTLYTLIKIQPLSRITK